MDIQKHHATGLELAITLLSRSKDKDPLEAVNQALTQSIAHEGPSYNELLARIAELEAELSPLKRQENFRIMQQEEDRRIQVISDLLFPEYYWDRKEADKPPRHPGKACWWNGATLISSSVDGSFLWLKVSSYVGGGETEEFECQVPSEWLELEDPTEVVQDWCRKEMAEEHERAQQKRLRDAQTELEHKRRQLTRLQSEIDSFSNQG